jgi:hypothetical protein
VLADGAEDGRRVLLLSHGPRIPLSGTGQLVLKGEGYATEAEALEAASRWRWRLRFAFAGSLIGADFYLRAPSQHITPLGLAHFRGLLRSRSTGLPARLGLLCGGVGRRAEVVAAALIRAESRLLGGPAVEGDRVLEDVRGTQVHECEPRPLFLAVNLEVTVKRSLERFLTLIAAATQQDVRLNEKEELAFELFSGSFFQPTADGRLLMLMMAVESRIEQELRAEASLGLVEQFVEAAKAAGLPPEERDPLVNGLRTFKRESISRAGKRLAATLGTRTYLEHAPATFFRDCYSLRSRLVHGDAYPSLDEVNNAGGALELFVRDLLTLPLGVDLT